MLHYRQCELSKGPSREVAWIPEQFAVAGKVLRIGDDDGWRVEAAGAVRKTRDQIESHERDHLGHRSRTDI